MAAVIRLDKALPSTTAPVLMAAAVVAEERDELLLPEDPLLR